MNCLYSSRLPGLPSFLKSIPARKKGAKFKFRRQFGWSRREPLPTPGPKVTKSSFLLTRFDSQWFKSRRQRKDFFSPVASFLSVSDFVFWRRDAAKPGQARPSQPATKAIICSYIVVMLYRCTARPLLSSLSLFLWVNRVVRYVYIL